MNEERTRNVNEIITLACEVYRYSEADIDSDRRKAIQRKIRRHLSTKPQYSAPYTIPESAAQDLVRWDLKDYFFGQFAPAGAAARERERVKRAKEALASHRNAIEMMDHDEEMRVLHDTASDFGISNADFDRFMLRSIFRSIHSNFDETRFRLDYEERNAITDVLQWPNPDDPSHIRLATRHHELSEKLGPALEQGDPSAYLKEGE